MKQEVKTGVVVEFSILTPEQMKERQEQEAKDAS